MFLKVLASLRLVDVVWIKYQDGSLHLHRAWALPQGGYASNSRLTKLILNPDGTIKHGISYIDSWLPYRVGKKMHEWICGDLYLAKLERQMAGTDQSLSI